MLVTYEYIVFCCVLLPRFPHDKLHTLDSAQEGLALLRLLANHKLRDMMYRDRRAHLLADDVEFELTSQQVSH